MQLQNKTDNVVKKLSVQPGKDFDSNVYREGINSLNLNNVLCAVLNFGRRKGLDLYNDGQ